MPSRNIIRNFHPEAYYHVYNRGVEKRTIFLDNQDYTVFLGLIKKYLSGENHNPNNRHKSSVLSLAGEVDLLAYCLMPNHFHLLLYQHSESGITKLLRRVSTGYAMYFNNRYNRVGVLFQSRFKAARIDSDRYLHHISRYIHLNPTEYRQWPYSSLAYYESAKSSAWLNTQPILNLFNDNSQEYLSFLNDYIETRDELQLLKRQLASDPEV